MSLGFLGGGDMNLELLVDENGFWRITWREYLPERFESEEEAREFIERLSMSNSKILKTQLSEGESQILVKKTFHLRRAGDPIPVLSETEKKIIEYLDLGLSLVEIQRVLQFKTMKSLTDRLEKMAERGLVRKIGRGKWVVTGKGYNSRVCPLSEKEIRIVRLLCDEGMEMIDIAHRLDENYSTVKAIVRQLLRKRVIRKVGHGKYERVKDWTQHISLESLDSEAI